MIQRVLQCIELTFYFACETWTKGRNYDVIGRDRL